MADNEAIILSEAGGAAAVPTEKAPCFRYLPLPRAKGAKGENYARDDHPAA